MAMARDQANHEENVHFHRWLLKICPTTWKIHKKYHEHNQLSFKALN